MVSLFSSTVLDPRRFFPGMLDKVVRGITLLFLECSVSYRFAELIFYIKIVDYS